MEQLKTPETQPELQSPQIQNPEGFTPSDVMNHEPGAYEAIEPASEEQVDAILSDAGNMMSELPTVRHSEQDRFDLVDVDEAALDGVTVKHIHGKEGDVTVIEPNLDNKSALIVIDNVSKAITVDGVPVDEAGATAVAGVIKQTRNMNSQPTQQEEDRVGNAESADTLQVDSIQETEPAQQTEQQSSLSPEQQEKMLQRKRQVLGVVGELLRTKNGVMAFKQLATQIGVEPGDLQEKMQSGDITITPDTMRALEQLRRDGAQPKSEVWATDPRTGSMLGGAARESQQLLSNVIKNMF